MSVLIKSTRQSMPYITGQIMSFRYGDENIAFERVQRINSTGKVIIKIYPDCRVVVLAPTATSNEMVLRAVQKRSRWIYQQLREFRKQNEFITPRQYISGESHYYLGKQYLLKVLEVSGQTQSVKLQRGRLEVTVQKRCADTVKTLLLAWYKLRAKIIFNKRLDLLLEQALWVKEKPSLSIIAMQTQWGSCSPKGQITLNPHLIKASSECIDYVILHELCHIAEHNHSKKFYRLMQQVMPGWEGTKDKLDKMASRILA